MSEDIDKPLPVTPSSVSLSDMGNEEGTTGDYIFTPHSSEERLLGVARLSGNSAEIETGATSPIPDGPTFKKRSGLFGLRSKSKSTF